VLGGAPSRSVGLVAKRVGAQTFWLHGDHQGSVKAITDAAGTVVQRRKYWAYGARRADETDHPEARGYIGQSLDEETGLSYLQARYYDSELGLFASPDPMPPLAPGVGLNRYAYALGNPANYIDPSGLNATKLEPGGETVYVVGRAPPMTFTDPGLIGAVLNPKRGGGSSGGSTGAGKVQATKPPPTDPRDPVETKKPEEEDPAKTQPTAQPHDRHADQERALEVLDSGEKVTDVVLDVLESMKTVPGDLINALMPNIGLKLDIAQTIAQPNLENTFELTLSALEMPRVFGVANSVVSAAGRLNLGWSYLQIARWEAQAVNDHFYTPTARNIYTVFCNPRHRVAYCP
jgi:RHS repeat-associated protein